MSRTAAFLAVLALCLSAAAARELLAPVPVPAPSGATVTVPNWFNGAKLANVTLPVGGTLVIPWKGLHGVFETASFACPTTFPTPNTNGLGLVAGPVQSGTFTHTFTSSGTYFFACPVDDHCNQGLLIAVSVS